MDRYKIKIFLIILISTLFLISCSGNIPNESNSEILSEEIIEIIPEIPSTLEPTLEIASPPLPMANNYEIITLLPFDAIQAIDNPEFLSPEEADSEYSPNELVLGVSINGEAKAYSINLLSSHEIVNDSVGGAKIAVTW